jgi:para-aminobenzoate synthetase component I
MGGAVYRELLDGAFDDTRVVELVGSLAGRPGLAWLDGDGSAAGRWSWVTSDPVEVVEVSAGGDVLSAMGSLEGIECDSSSTHVPRWIGWIAYDAAWVGGALDGAPPRHAAEREHDGAVLRFARYEAAVGIDHDTGRAWVYAESIAALGRWRELVGASSESSGAAPLARVMGVRSTSEEAHRDAIELAREAIARGELYQVNLARRWEGRFEGDTLALALAMREASPVPFGMYLAGESSLVGRSMERFLAWDGVSLETRPIKGTIARAGADGDEVDALRSDVKERAEHTMIVDLLRNDLARVAETGSVEVVGALSVEPYARLHHLVTTVRCRTRPGVGLREILAATFPPGSVTGAPKLAAVDLIERLEPFARGVYCGAYGYVTRSGALSLAVAIRTAVIEGNRVRYFAGGGIVWPSDADREVAETDLKARAFLEAVERLA